jgi:hypothetical protein
VQKKREVRRELSSDGGVETGHRKVRHKAPSAWWRGYLREIPYNGPYKITRYKIDRKQRFSARRGAEAFKC